MNSKQTELHFHIYQNKLENISDREDLSAEIMGLDTEKKVIKAIKELPGPCNVVLENYFLHEKSSKEIMQDLQISNTKFYNLLHKGKYLLRCQLNPSFYQNANEILYGRSH